MQLELDYNFVSYSPIQNGSKWFTNNKLRREISDFDVNLCLELDAKINPSRLLSEFAIQTDIAATAAVSARNIRGPSDTANAAGCARITAFSSSVKPPSGPIKIAAGPVANPLPANLLATALVAEIQCPVSGASP